MDDVFPITVTLKKAEASEVKQWCEENDIKISDLDIVNNMEIFHALSRDSGLRRKYLLYRKEDAVLFRLRWG